MGSIQPPITLIDRGREGKVEGFRHKSYAKCEYLKSGTALANKESTGGEAAGPKRSNTPYQVGRFT